MPFKSLSHAKIFLVLFLLIASTSFYFGKQWAEEARAVKSSLAKMTKEKADAEGALAELQKILTPDAALLTLDTAVSAALLDVYNLRVRNGIAITAIVPGKQGGSGDMRQVTSLADDVPGTSLKTIKVNVEGNYKTYTGLMGYLESLQQGPVAVTRLKVNDRNFELSLRIFGSMEKS